MPSEGQAPLGTTGTPCLPKEAFDLATWAGGGEFDVEVSARLMEISDDRDRLNSEAIEALARTYLSFGFGREAARTLDMDGRSSRGRDELRLLARLVDGEAVPSGAFEDQAGCLGPVALWRALARETLQGTDERERTSMILALRLLPPALQGSIALRVAGLLLKAGDALGAEEVVALAEEEGTGARLTQAEIIRETEGPARALAELETIAENDARMTPEGLVELIDLSIAEGKAVPEETLELARTLRFEQGGEDARALLLAEVRALTAASRFEEALALLRQEQLAHSGEDLNATLAATVQALTERLGDAAFLELALGGLPSDLPSEAREGVARRLADLGFPGEAESFRSAGTPRAPLAPFLIGDLPVRDWAFPGAGIDAAPVAAPAGLSDPVSRRTVAWMEPPPLLDPVDDALAEEPEQPPPAADMQAVAPLAQSATKSNAADPVQAATMPGALPASDLSATLTTLAARRALLDRAGEARAQAAALLDKAPIE